MDISLDKLSPDDWEFTLALRLDSTVAARLQEALTLERIAAVRIVRLDLAGVAYLSSAALRVFLATHKALVSRGGGLVLTRVPEYCRSVLEIAGFDKLTAGAFGESARRLRGVDAGHRGMPRTPAIPERTRAWLRFSYRANGGHVLPGHESARALCLGLLEGARNPTGPPARRLDRQGGSAAHRPRVLRLGLYRPAPRPRVSTMSCAPIRPGASRVGG